MGLQRIWYNWSSWARTHIPIPGLQMRKRKFSDGKQFQTWSKWLDQEIMMSSRFQYIQFQRKQWLVRAGVVQKRWALINFIIDFRNWYLHQEAVGHTGSLPQACDSIHCGCTGRVAVPDPPGREDLRLWFVSSTLLLKQKLSKGKDVYLHQIIHGNSALKTFSVFDYLSPSHFQTKLTFPLGNYLCTCVCLVASVVFSSLLFHTLGLGAVGCGVDLFSGSSEKFRGLQTLGDLTKLALVVCISRSAMSDSATSWTVALQTSLPMGFPR